MRQVVGNDDLCRKLCESIISDKLPHAFILEGQRGTGKHTLAKNVAAALACTHRSSDSFPCGECPDCKKIFGGICPDVITLGCEGKATFGVEAIRFLRADVHVVPNDLDFKLYIIEDADKMTVQAQNAFLLTLEEPPSFVRFILLCQSSSPLLETIRSRAPIMRTQAVSGELLDEYICSVDRRAAQMKLTSPDEYAELLMAARGGIGTALEYLDSKVFASVKRERALAADFAEMATSGSGAAAAFPLISRFSQKRDALSSELSVLSEALCDLLLLKKCENAPTRFFADKNRALEMCDRASAAQLYDLCSATVAAQSRIQRNANVRLTLIKLLSDAKII